MVFDDWFDDIIVLWCLGGVVELGFKGVVIGMCVCMCVVLWVVGCCARVDGARARGLGGGEIICLCGDV